MNKSKLIAILAVLVLSVFMLCGCGNQKTEDTEPQSASTGANVDATVDAKTEENATSAEISDGKDIVELPSQGENDLEIITVPQQSEKPQNNTETIAELTEAVQEITEAESTTAIQKIELPFVPAV